MRRAAVDLGLGLLALTGAGLCVHRSLGPLRAVLLPGEGAAAVAWELGGLAVLALLVGLLVALPPGRGPRRSLRAAALVPASLALLPGGPATSSVAVPRGPPGPVLVLVTLDTFRADHLGRIGGASVPVPTPALDGLADQGLLFTAGLSPAPLTLPAHTAMLTGQLPDRVGVLRNGQALDPAVPTVAQALAAAGWRTGAAVSAAVLAHGSGIERGFGWYDDQLGGVGLPATSVGRLAAAVGLAGEPVVERRGDATLARALAWLEAGGGPTFLWLHLYDPHAPYAPPSPYDTLVAPETPGLPGAPEEVRAARLRTMRDRHLSLVPGRDDLRPQVAAYKGEIAWTDHLVGRLLSALPPDAAVVLAADHGESFTEHDYLLNHGDRVHEPGVRVPILVRAPGVAPGQRIDAPVPLQAVAPTLLALAGQPAQGGLLDLAQAPPTEPLRAFAGTQRARRILGPFQRAEVAFRQGTRKWTVDSEGTVLGFDLAADPGEQAPLPLPEEERATWAARGTAELEHLRTAGEAARIAHEQQEALRALGYVE
ncbi:sulfatase [Myxococcota bacterium]|nr:sulfatase [Myxococcota bacterium]